MDLSSVLADAGGATRILVRSVAFGSAVVVIGASAFRWIVVASAAKARVKTADIEVHVATIGMIAAAVLAIGAPWRILGQADAFMSPGDPLAPALVNVMNTAWGRAAGVQVIAAIIALAGFWFARGMVPNGWRVALVASVLMAATPAWMGHAAATDSQPLVAMGADILHVGAAGSWGGAVVVLALVLRYLKRQAMGGIPAAELIARLRPLALTAAGVLLVTGVASALFRLTSPADLFTSPYGLMLSGKLVIVAIAAALGKRHSDTAAARARADGAGAVAASIGGEALLLLLVVAVSALLSASPPPGD